MKEYIKKIIVQKLAGLSLLVGSAWMIYNAIGATNLEDKDCTAILIMIPLGFILLCHKPFTELD